MFINQKIIKFFILLICFNIFSSISQTNEDIPLDNIAINEIPRPISSIIFEDFTNNKIQLSDYKGKLIIINFWATWCAPCKKEMPSLDKLHKNDNIEVFAINVEKKNKNKTKKFFKDLDIENLSIYFDPELELTKSLSLRGLPTSIILNQDKKEVARIIGEVDFNDFNLLNWLLDI